MTLPPHSAIYSEYFVEVTYHAWLQTRYLFLRHCFPPKGGSASVQAGLTSVLLKSYNERVIVNCVSRCTMLLKHFEGIFVRRWMLIYAICYLSSLATCIVCFVYVYLPLFPPQVHLPRGYTRMAPEASRSSRDPKSTQIHIVPVLDTDTRHSQRRAG